MVFAKERSNSPNCSPRTVEIHQVQSIDTIDNISVNKQRQMPRPSTAQWRDPGDVRCDATQVPTIQDHSEWWKCNRSRSSIGWRKSLSQSKDKCQRSKRHGNSRKFTDRIVDVPIVLKRRFRPAQVLDRAEDFPTTDAKDAENGAGSLIEPLTSCCVGETDSAQTLCHRYRNIRSPHHKQVRRQMQRQDSRERVVSGSRRNGARSD